MAQYWLDMMIQLFCQQQLLGKNQKIVDFFPLTVTYEEKLYSVGKIPGGFLKREGRPSNMEH